MNRVWQTRVAAILGIAAIEIAAIQAGMNGHMMALSLAAIAGISGYSLGLFRPQPDPERSVDPEAQ